MRRRSPARQVPIRPSVRTGNASAGRARLAYDRSMETDLYHAGPNARRPPFRFSARARVWFSDTDAQGVVYYGRYLPYFDHARMEYHRHLGLKSLYHGEHEFVMRAMTVEYEAPATFDDLLEIFTRTTRIGRTSATVEYAAHRVADDVLMCTAVQTVVLIDGATRRPTEIPDSYRVAIDGFEGGAETR
jgi:acyl-CoA thioester hydrolase